MHSLFLSSQQTLYDRTIQKYFILTADSSQVFTFTSSPTQLHIFDTSPNPRGLCSLSPSCDNSVLAMPGTKVKSGLWLVQTGHVIWILTCDWFRSGSCSLLISSVQTLRPWRSPPTTPPSPSSSSMCRSVSVSVSAPDYGHIISYLFLFPGHQSGHRQHQGHADQSLWHDLRLYPYRAQKVSCCWFLAPSETQAVRLHLSGERERREKVGESSERILMQTFLRILLELSPTFSLIHHRTVGA